MKKIIFFIIISLIASSVFSQETILELAETSIEVGHFENSRSIDISTNRTLFFTSPSWITVELNYDGDTSITIFPESNYYGERTGIVYISAYDADTTTRILQVTQRSGIYVLEDSIFFSHTHFEVDSIQIHTNVGLHVFAPDWLTVDLVLAGADSFYVVRPQWNQYGAREGTIHLWTIDDNADSVSFYVYVQQSQGVIIPNPYASFSRFGGTESVRVRVNGSLNIDAPSWVNAYFETNSDTALVISTEYNEGPPRDGTIFLVGLDEDSTRFPIYVHQANGILPAQVSNSDTLFIIGTAGLTDTIPLRTKNEFYINAPNWINAKVEYSVDTFISFSVPYLAGGFREGYIDIIGFDEDTTTTSIHIIQESNLEPTFLDLGDTVVSLRSWGGADSVTIRCNYETRYETPEWVTVQKRYFRSDTFLVISAQRNIGDDRDGYVYVIAGPDSAMSYIHVFQPTDIEPTFLYLGDTVVSLRSWGGADSVTIRCNYETRYEVPEWVTVQKRHFRSDTFLVISAQRNIGDDRDGYVYVIAGPDSAMSYIHVFQPTDIEPSFIFLGDTVLFLNTRGDADSVTIRSNYPIQYSLPDWLTVQKRYSTDTFLVISASRNTGIERSFYVNFTTSVDTRGVILHVIQQAINPYESMNVVSSSGQLSNSIPLEARESVINLTITGSIDVRDLLFIRDSLPLVENLDIENANIIEFTGDIDSLLLKAVRTFESNTIPSGALQGKENLKQISLPISLEAIEDSAFGGCTKLEKIVINNSPDKITVSESAFKDVNKEICEIVIPANTSSNISEHSFWNTFSLITEENSQVNIKDLPVGVTVYPTVSEGIYMIKGLESDAVISIYSMQGKLLRKEQLTGNNSVSLENEPDGLYLIIINGCVFRIIKE